MAILSNDRFLVQRSGRSYRVDASSVASLAGDSLQSATDRGSHTTNNVGIGNTPGNANINLRANGRIGIGKDDPSVELDIVGKARSTGTVAGDDLTTLVTKGYVDTSVTDGASILSITGGDAITATSPDVNKDVVITVDYDTNKGLDIDTEKLVTKLGAGLEFDADGKIAVSTNSLAYRGTVDLTSSVIPSPATQGDTYANDTLGALSSEWKTALSKGDTTVGEGDLVVYNGTEWTYIPTGSVIPPTDLGIDNRTTTTLDITSSSGDDVTVPEVTTTLAGLMTKDDKVALDTLVATDETLQSITDNGAHTTNALTLGGTVLAPNTTLAADGSATFSGDISPDTDGGSNLGSAAVRFANVYTQDMHFSNEGTEGNDVDGTWGNWTLQEGEDNLFLINNRSGMKFKISMEPV